MKWQDADDEWVDGDGYPTDAALKRVREWPIEDERGFFDFLKSIWWGADWGWHEKDGGDCDCNGGDQGDGLCAIPHESSCATNDRIRQFHISTAGWSGNEEIVGAFKENWLMWSHTWVSTRRGGHYVFEVKA